MTDGLKTIVLGFGITEGYNKVKHPYRVWTDNTADCCSHHDYFVTLIHLSPFHTFPDEKPMIPDDKYGQPRTIWHDLAS